MEEISHEPMNHYSNAIPTDPYPRLIDEANPQITLNDTANRIVRSVESVKTKAPMILPTNLNQSTTNILQNSPQKQVLQT